LSLPSTGSFAFRELQPALIEGFPDSVKKMVCLLHPGEIVLHSLSLLALASAQPFLTD
jgi:hypothetical protein